MRSNRNTSLLRAEDAILIVVDMQEPFLMKIWEKESVIQNTVRLIKAASILRLPIVPTLQYERKMGGLIPQVASAIPKQFVPFDKLSFSAVGDAAFLSEVQRAGRKQALLCGVETHICIHQTAQDLIKLGLAVHIAADAVSSRAQSNWEIGIRRMEQSGVIISSTEMAIYEMLEEAGTPEFKQILELIK
jgi:nicotinamidase-related amidase